MSTKYTEEGVMKDLIMKYVSCLPGATVLPNQGSLDRRLGWANTLLDYQARWDINGMRPEHQKYAIIERT